MSERLGGLPVDMTTTMPGVEPVTPEREKELAKLKVDADYAAQQQAHQEKQATGK